MARPKGSKNFPTVASVYKQILKESLKDLSDNPSNYTTEQKLEQLEKLNKLEQEFIAKQN